MPSDRARVGTSVSHHVGQSAELGQQAAQGQSLAGNRGLIAFRHVEQVVVGKVERGPRRKRSAFARAVAQGDQADVEQVTLADVVPLADDLRAVGGKDGMNGGANRRVIHGIRRLRPARHKPGRAALRDLLLRLLPRGGRIARSRSPASRSAACKRGKARSRSWVNACIWFVTCEKSSIGVGREDSDSGIRGQRRRRGKLIAHRPIGRRSGQPDFIIRFDPSAVSLRPNEIPGRVPGRQRDGP